MKIFNGVSANEVWLKAVKEIKKNYPSNLIKSQFGNTFEIMHAGFTIKDPTRRWVMSKYPPINIAFSLIEVIWIIRGRQDAKFLNYWNTKLPLFAGYSKYYHGSYGFRLRKNFGVDQLSRITDILSNNRSTRQAILQIWDVRKDLPNKNGNPKNRDIPCNVNSLLKIRNEKLEWMQIIRSNDLLLGVPYNFVQFTFLQEIIAGWLGVGIGDYNQISDSLHLYENSYDDLRSTLPHRSFKSVDSISFPKRISESLFKELEKRVEKLIKSDLTVNEHLKLSNWDSAPSSFLNIFLVLSAEAARRRKWDDLANEIISLCKNPAYCYLWNNWQKEILKKRALKNM